MATYFDMSSTAALRDGFNGIVFLEGDPGYDEARSVWNGQIDKRPAVIARCCTVSDVQAAVAFARQHGLKATPRGAGHNVGGTGVNDGGMVVDLSPMRAVTADPQSAIAWAQAGATWRDVDVVTQQHARAVPGGVVSTTGIAGLSLGGGYSNQRRRDGMTIDNIVSMEVVLADGRIVRASADEHADLFWALRGGNETMGVVTSFEYRMHPVGPEIQSIHVAYPIDQIDAVFEAYRELSHGAPDELSTVILVWGLPPFPGLEDRAGEPYVGIAGTYVGALEDADAITKPYREIVEPIGDFTHTATYLEDQQALDPFFPDGLQYFWKSLYANELSDDTLEIVKRRSLERPSPRTLMVIRHLGGAMKRVPADATAFGARDAEWLVSIDSTWEDPAASEQNIAYTRSFYDELLPYSDGRQYVNFASDGGDTPSDRVKAIKANYDPDGIF